MRDVICKLQSLRTVEKRSAYLKDLTRHDEILYVDQKLTHSWKELAEFEKTRASKVNGKDSKTKIIQGRELIISLPQELANDEEKLKKVVDALRINLLGDKDYELAVHRKDKANVNLEGDELENTNLHVHIMYSERDINHKNIYSKDVWMNPETKKFCKPNEGILIHKKGDLKGDQDKVDKFTAKDKKYKDKNYIVEAKDTILKTFKDFEFNDYRIITKDSIYVKSKNWNIHSDEEYKNYVIFYNKEVKKFNDKQEMFENYGFPYDDLMEMKNNFNKLVRKKYKENYKQNDNALTYHTMGDYAEAFNERYDMPIGEASKLFLIKKEMVNHKKYYNYNNLHKLFFNERWSKEGKSLLRKLYYHYNNTATTLREKNELLEGAITDIIGFNPELEPLLGDVKFYEYAKEKLADSMKYMDASNYLNNKEVCSRDYKNNVHIFYDTFANNNELDMLCKQLIDTLSKYNPALGIKYIPVEELIGLDEAIDYLIRKGDLEKALKLQKFKEEINE